MTRAARPLALFAAVAAGCSFGSEGVSGGNSIGADDSSGGTASADDGGMTSAAGPTSAASMSGDGTTSGPPDATTSGPIDPTATDGTSSTAEDTGPPAGEPVHAQHGDHSTCNTPVWCFSGDVSNPVGGAHAGQECFSSPIDPPLDIVSIDYVVGGVTPQVQSFFIEVYTTTGGEPSSQLASFPLGAAEATVGPHTFELPTPVTITDTRFCVGFRAPEGGLAGSLGMAVDTDSQLATASWVSVPSCGAPEWTQAVGNTTPSGNWCIGVDVLPTAG